jgi:hypothetical protein
MAVFRLSKDSIEQLPETTFAAKGIKERDDLQRLLKSNIAVIAPDVLVIAEEFAEWEDSKRRIDLLCVDRGANLVVVELKRDDDGGHMELQAIRYAAMVSSMTFARAAEVFQSFLDRFESGQDANAQLLSYLGWDEPREDDFARDVRIILVAADFSKEITTSVLWLNERDLDVRCVRLKPYANGIETILDVQQVVPLPEAEEYTVQIKQKGQAARADSARSLGRHAFWSVVLPLVSKQHPRWAGRSPAETSWLGASSGVRGLRFDLWVQLSNAGCQLCIDAGPGKQAWNKAVFDTLYAKRDEIELAYGGPLGWHRIDNKQSSIVSSKGVESGFRAPREEWPETARKLVDEVRRFEASLQAHLKAATDAAASTA